MQLDDSHGPRWRLSPLSFIGLAVMTPLYARNRHDTVFLQEHCTQQNIFRVLGWLRLWVAQRFGRAAIP
jgi:hypothetical protein